MRKLIVFNHVTLDGYFTGENGDFNWARAGNDDPEYAAFVAQNASGGGQLLMGRITYELMVSFWPTAAAMQHMPAVAEGMNRMPKVVFSKTLSSVTWNNTRLIKSDMVTEVQSMKNGTGDTLVILGSGNIVSQLASEGLIDEYQLVINPVVLGKGRTLFNGIGKTLRLNRVGSRIFQNGKTLLCYEPAA